MEHETFKHYCTYTCYTFLLESNVLHTKTTKERENVLAFTVKQCTSSINIYPTPWTMLNTIIYLLCTVHCLISSILMFYFTFPYILLSLDSTISRFCTFQASSHKFHYLLWLQKHNFLYFLKLTCITIMLYNITNTTLVNLHSLL